MELALICMLAISAVDAAPTRVVFPDDSQRTARKLDEPLTPPVLPVLPHLENDPSTLLEGDKVAPRTAEPSESSELNPRFGFNHGADLSPNEDGGLTATFNGGYSGLGNSQSVAHSFAFGFNKGFQASQSSSSSSSFSNPGFVGSQFSNSQASSQASSFSAGSNGLSASAAAASAAASAANGQSSANSQSAGFGASFGGNTVSGSQSGTSVSGNGNAFSNGAGFAASGSNGGNRPGNNYSGNRPGNNYSGNRPGSNYNGNRPGNYYPGNRPSFSGAAGSSYSSNGNNFGEGSIDIRNKPNNFGGVVTSIVFPGDSSRGKTDIDDSDEVITFDADRFLGGSSRYRSKNGGGLSEILSILID